MAVGVLRAGKLFFSSLVSLAKEKNELLASYRKNQIIFCKKCTSCGATRSKSKFVGLGEGINLLCRKCYNKMRRSPGVPAQQRQVSEGFDRGPNVNRRR